MAFADRNLGRDEPYILAHWRGNLPLAQSYWLNGVLASAICTLIVMSLGSFLEESSLNLTVVALVSILTVASSLSVGIWSWVGIWRSASKTNSGWAALAKASVVLGVLGHLGQASSLWEWGKETSQLAVGGDAIGDMARIEVIGQELRITGPLTNGIGSKVNVLLGQHPEITAVRINSIGGRLYEAEKIGDLVSGKGLNVIVDQDCSSACTVILLSGRMRALEADSGVGFHRPTYPGLNQTELNKLADDTAATYRRLGLRSSFINRVLEVSPDDMWYPKEQELFEYGVLNGFTKERIANDMKLDTERENGRTPHQVDEVTVLETVEHDGTVMRYFYRLDADASQLPSSFSTSIESSIKEELCSRPMMPEFFSSGARYQHIYLDRAGKRAAAVTINVCEQ